MNLIYPHKGLIKLNVSMSELVVGYLESLRLLSLSFPLYMDTQKDPHSNGISKNELTILVNPFVAKTEEIARVSFSTASFLFPFNRL